MAQVTANALWEPREASLCPLSYAQLALPRTRDPAHLLAQVPLLETQVHGQLFTVGGKVHGVR